MRELATDSTPLPSSNSSAGRPSRRCRQARRLVVPQSTAMKPSAKRMRRHYQNPGRRDMGPTLFFWATGLSSRCDNRSRMRCRCEGGARRRAGLGTREAALYWVDIKGRKVFRLGDDGKLEQWDTPMRIGSLAPRAGGGFIAGTDHGPGIHRPGVERFEIFANPEADAPRQSLQRRQGGPRRPLLGRHAWTIRERRPTGRLYRSIRTCAVTAIDSGYRVTNGPAFGPDRATSCTKTIGAAAHLRVRSRRSGQGHQPPRLRPLRQGRGLSRRNDGRCRRLPVDRLLGRLVRPPFFPRRASCLEDIDMPVAAADQLYLWRRGSRPSTSPRPAATSRNRVLHAAFSGGLFMRSPGGVRGSPNCRLRAEAARGD